MHVAIVIQDSGQIWNKDNMLEDIKCLIPDYSYAKMYQECISYCKIHGQFAYHDAGNRGKTTRGWCGGESSSCMRPGRQVRWRAGQETGHQDLAEELADKLVERRQAYQRS